MAAKIIEVNTNSLKSDVEVIWSELERISGNADRLLSILGQLETMWEGSAKQAFSSAVRDDVARLRELVKAMKDFTGKTSEARVEYDKCEIAVSEIVSSVRV